MNSGYDVMMTGSASGINLVGLCQAVVDVNNDGYDDVIVGAYGYNSKMGRSYVYYGGR